MRARTLVLPGEDPVGYERRLAALLERHDPQDQATRFEVEWAAKAAWKMERGEVVEAALAVKAIHDACRGNGDPQADEVERLGAELAAQPASTLRQLRKTPAGCLFCLAQYEILRNHLDSHAGLLGTQRHRALQLVGKRMTDVLAGDPLAIRWFCAVIGASFGDQGDILDVVAKSLGNKPPDAMTTSEFQIHVKDLAAQVPGQAEGCARLKAYLAEAIAALREHLTFVQEIDETNRAIAVQSARIDLGGEGKQLLKYQATQERSYQAALRRLDAGQNSGRVGPGRPPKKSAAQVETTAPKAPVTTATQPVATTAAVTTDPEAMAATTTATATAATAEPGTTIEPTLATPAGNITTEAKRSPAATIETELPPGTTRDGLRLSTDRDESDRDVSDAEFLRQRALDRMVNAVYRGSVASDVPVARAVDQADGGELTPAAPGDDSGEKAPRPPPVGTSGG
jgi:hypothetical protein